MKYYIVDAFATQLFKGNQAGVCLLDDWLPDEMMQSIAAENNLAETAFVVGREGYYDLRWFTPAVEVDLCGHATLASAYIVSNFVDTDASEMEFHTKSGVLMVKKADDKSAICTAGYAAGELFEMDFPSRMPRKIETTELMEEAIGAKVLEAHLSRDMVLLLESEKHVKELQPDFALVEAIPDCFGLIVTAIGDSVDFVSRFFVPKAGIPEDPVTGSAHSTLIPFWSKRLGKTKMVAKQLSKRGGTLYCEDCGERVKISGNAVLYLKGEIML